MGLKEIGRDSVNWVHLAQNRDNWRALLNAISNFVTGLEFRRTLLDGLSQL